MIKKTLYFGNPAYLSLTNKQLVVKLPEVENADNIPEPIRKESVRTIPIEDIGIIILDHQRITITQGLIAALLENNAALISCSDKRMPTGMLLPLQGNTVHNERFRQQIDTTVPLKKQLWQQTIKAKIENQAAILSQHTSKSVARMYVMAKDVKSGDPDNYEAQAAVYYWRNIFTDMPDFIRDPDGTPPNNLLNYGYAILRATVARALVASGLLPVEGIHHHNRYNAYCLADDIMEPYRPYVDKLVIEIIYKYEEIPDELTVDMKSNLLSIPIIDVMIGGKKRPLMVAISETTSSLAKCFSGELRKISYPNAFISKI
jgi:CRISPR-associated endonuclease Cas1